LRSVKLHYYFYPAAELFYGSKQRRMSVLFIFFHLYCYPPGSTNLWYRLPQARTKR